LSSTGLFQEYNFTLYNQWEKRISNEANITQTHFKMDYWDKVKRFFILF